MTYNLSVKKLAIFLATGMYIGYSPFAPGTFGSLLGVIICFFLSTAGHLIYGIVLSVGFVVAIWSASIAEKHFDKKDPGQIVCDEVVGYIIAMFLVPFTLFNVIIVFLLFRFFDILKPFPIGVIDKKMNSGFGIVLDDVLAGIYSNITFSFITKLL
ncbi:MAG: phosphatidylglycerophosphatase A [Deltaproteobacteria bacterium]|nr:phosphatidylglycerophosphatase A [Deltaproteobacteria bacterium]